MLRPVLGPCSSRFERLKHILAFSVNAGATRFDRFDSLPGSIGTRCTCHRVPPCHQRSSTPPGGRPTHSPAT
eukprot:9292731-Alexandrium_andersonii.AAC.1